MLVGDRKDLLEVSASEFGDLLSLLRWGCLLLETFLESELEL